MNEIIKITVISKQEGVEIKKKSFYTEQTKESLENVKMFPAWESLDKTFYKHIFKSEMYENKFNANFYNSKCVIVSCYVWAEDATKEKSLSLIDLIENDFKLQKTQVDVNLENIYIFKKNFKE